MHQQPYLRVCGLPVCCTRAYTQVNFYPTFKEKRQVLVTFNKPQIQIIVLGGPTLLSAFVYSRIKPGTEYCKSTAHIHNSSPPLLCLHLLLV